jgi:hypothetical protein
VKRLTAAIAALTVPVLFVATPTSAQTPETTVQSSGTGDAVVVPLAQTIAGAEMDASKWVAINWTSLGGESRLVKVTAQGSDDGILATYPAYPVDGYSSGYYDDTLSENEIDYTALKLTIQTADENGAPYPGPRFIRVSVSWESDTGFHEDVYDMLIGDDDATGGTTSTTVGSTGPEAPAIAGFVLVDPAENSDIGALIDGSVVDRDDVGRSIAIRADVGGAHESVKFYLNGEPVRTGNTEPYSLYSENDSNQNLYTPWSPKFGTTYTLTAVPYSEDDGAGIEGEPMTITFTYQK